MRRLYCLAFIILAGCSHTSSEYSQENLHLLPFDESKLAKDLVGRKLHWNASSFWEFSKEDKLQVRVVKPYVTIDSCNVLVSVDTTKDGVKYLIGKIWMQYKKIPFGWQLDQLRTTADVFLQEQIR